MRNEEELSRTSSAAKGIDPQGLEGTSLENAPEAGQAFDQARQDSPSPTQPEQGEGLGSEQVRGEGQRNEMQPPPEIAAGPDRDAHEAQMGADDKAAQEKNDLALLQRTQDGQQQGQGMSQGLER